MKLEDMKLCTLTVMGYEMDDLVSVWLDRALGKSCYRTKSETVAEGRRMTWTFAATPYECAKLKGYLDELGIKYTGRFAEEKAAKDKPGEKPELSSADISQKQQNKNQYLKKGSKR